VTRDEFNDWREWRFTQDIFRYLRKRQDSALQKLIDYGFGEDVGAVALGAARNSGIVAGINEVLELDYDDLTDEIRRGEEV
jgi:hypothetical protein